MSVSYTAPLRRSWTRMKRMLFQPFRFEAWLSLGVAAFLSEYLHRLGGGGSKYSWHGKEHAPIGVALRAIAGFLEHPLWGPLVLLVVFLSLCVGLLLLWLSSRGKFVFLDDVLRERYSVVEPWNRLGRLGDSLFVFWLGFTLVTIGTFIALTLPLLPAILAAVNGGTAWEILGALAVGWWLAMVIPLAIVVGYVHLFLFHFVVPIMHRDQIGVLAAWRRFLPLFRSHALEFLAFGLFFLGLLVVVAAAVLTVGFSTCCIGFLLLWLPYVGSVITLPIEVTLRGLGPEFLAEFGPEWTMVPVAIAPPSPPAGDAS